MSELPIVLFAEYSTGYCRWLRVMAKSRLAIGRLLIRRLPAGYGSPIRGLQQVYWLAHLHAARDHPAVCDCITEGPAVSTSSRQLAKIGYTTIPHGVDPVGRCKRRTEGRITKPDRRRLQTVDYY